MAYTGNLTKGRKLTKENFKSHSIEMGILPFWFWNGEMNEEEMEWQMKEYHDKGIPGLFIHGRFGEKIGYLSDTWMKRTQYAVKKAKEIGIDVWIYDEMNWPSGTAYREVPKKNPKLRQKYLEMVSLPVPGPLFTFLEATDDRYVNTGDSKPIAAYACSEEEYQNGIENIIDLTPNLSFDAVIPWEAPPGKWRLLYFLEKEIDYYIDALNPESTREFLNSTYEKYKDSVGKDFGGIVPGFYTDEPAMHYYHVGMQNQVVPWTAQMFKIFRERRGYDLKPFLPALFLSMGEQTSKLRYDFWKTLTEQYSDSYYKQIREWCESNNVIFTGHLLFEEWLWGHARCEGNIFKHLEHMHITGVDHLYPIIGSEKAPDQHVALKIASSAAHHFGSERLLCESMGGTYWDCTLERMKWIADWEYLLGVTIFNNHGYHYSIEGERKRDWPPSQFYHHTWWKYYNYFTEYMARLGHILTGGRHVAKVLMIYPINSAWTNYKPSGPDEKLNMIQGDFNYLTDTLLRLHYDFDYADEDILAGAEVSDGKLTIRDEEYSLLILPPLTHIQQNAFNKIKEFTAAGGKVIACSLLPVDLLDYKGEEATKELSGLFSVDPVKFNEDSSRLGNSSVLENGNVFIIKGGGLSEAKPKSLIDETIRKCITPDVTISSENVLYLHRVKDNYDIYFFVSSDKEIHRDVEISFEKIGKPELWNPLTGDITPIYCYNIKDNRLYITLDFMETDSKIIVLKDPVEDLYISGTNLNIRSHGENRITGTSENGDVPFISIHNGESEKVLSTDLVESLPDIKLDSNYEFELEDDNVLLIKNWKMKPASELKNAEDVVSTSYDDSQWLDVTMGAWEMQLPQERDDETYPVDVWYRINFTAEYIPDDIRIIIDGFSGSEHLLFINGNEIKEEGSRSRLDAEMKEIMIKKFLVEGENLIAVKLTAERRTDGLLDYIKIIGAFELKPVKSDYIIVKKRDKLEIGDWTKQGYPFYSGTIKYKSQFSIDKNYLDGELFIALDCGEDVAEAVINEHSVVMPWHPYKHEITEYVNEGKNSIEIKITNTLINILEGVQKESGMFKEPVLLHRHLYSLTY